MTGTQTDTLLIRNTKAWVGCCYLLSLKRRKGLNSDKAIYCCLWILNESFKQPIIKLLIHSPRFHRHTSIRCTTIVSPLAVALFTGPSRLPQDALVQPEDNIANGANQDDSDSDADDEEKGQRAGLKLDDWIVLRADTEVGTYSRLLFFCLDYLPIKGTSKLSLGGYQHQAGNSQSLSNNISFTCIAQIKKFWFKN